MGEKNVGQKITCSTQKLRLVLIEESSQGLVGWLKIDLTSFVSFPEVCGMKSNLSIRTLCSYEFVLFLFQTKPFVRMAPNPLRIKDVNKTSHSQASGVNECLQAAHRLLRSASSTQ